MPTTVADQFASMLSAVGVKRIYDVVSDSLNGLTDVIWRQGKIEWVHVRHEEVTAFAHDGPVLIDAVVNRTELAMPPSIIGEMAKGFSLYMVRAIVRGRTDKVVDLAKTNLWR